MTKDETNFVIIPIKILDKAKSRLSKYLPNEKRKQFCLAMFEDVIKTHGLNSIISNTVNWCVENSATSVLVLPADIPLITVKDLDEIYSLAERASMTISPSRDGRGTNALLLKPPKISSTFYGTLSFQKHIQEATKLGLKFLCYTSPRIALDIDTINDLKYFVSLRAKQTLAYNELEKAGLISILETFS
jgi:2-phospho-L-lactate guanylyltransferase (CobY/MobA/RfbA family)